MFTQYLSCNFVNIKIIWVYTHQEISFKRLFPYNKVLIQNVNVDRICSKKLKKQSNKHDFN